MKNNLWILFTFGFFLITQGFPQPPNDEDDLDYIMEEADGDTAGEDEGNNGPPPILHSKNATIILEMGATAKLPCEVENDDNAVILWWMGKTILWTDKIIQGSVTHSNFKLTDDHTLVISEFKPSDSGIFMCEVVHSSNRQNVTYEVYLAEKPKIVEIHPDGEKKIVEKGSPLTLTCNASGHPTPVIEWYKKTRHGEENLRVSTVSFDSVTRKNTGVYECRASNSKGNDSRKIEIHIQYDPEVEVENEIVYSGEGFELELVCTVHAEPKAKVSWMKDEHPLEVPPHHINLSDKGNKHFLRISGTTKNDFGVYRCIGQNSKGTTTKTITLSGKPTKPVFHAAQESPDSKSPILSWSIESYSPISVYEIIYRLQDKSDRQSEEFKADGPMSPDSTKYIARYAFDKLQPGTYQAQLRAKNDFGWSELSDSHPFSGNVVHSSNIIKDAVSETLESSDKTSSASELRISSAFVMSLLVIRYYC